MRILMTMQTLTAIGVIAGGAEAQATWQVDSRPLLDVTGVTAGGGVAFGGVNWATRFPDGTIVVADAGGPSLQYFDARGALLKSVGRRGQGPGDFTRVTWVGRCVADTAFAFDFVQSRMTTFDAQGTHGRLISVPRGGGGAQIVTSCNRSPHFALFGRGRRLPPPTPPDPKIGYFIVRMVAPLQIVDGSGQVVAATGEVPVLEGLGGVSDGAGGMPRPLGQTTLFALSADRLYVGTGDSAAIDVYSLAGERQRTIQLEIPVRAPTRSQYESASNVYLSIVPAGRREAMREWLQGIPMPERLPPYSALLTDATGLLWVVLSVPGDSNTRLRVVRESGTVAADVTVPVNLTVFEIGTDYILGGREDENGEPHLMLFRLRRGG